MVSYRQMVDMLIQVGMITKQWTGFGKEAFTDADNFGISFPLDLDVKVNYNLHQCRINLEFNLGKSNLAWSSVSD